MHIINRESNLFIWILSGGSTRGARTRSAAGRGRGAPAQGRGTAARGGQQTARKTNNSTYRVPNKLRKYAAGTPQANTVSESIQYSFVRSEILPLFKWTSYTRYTHLLTFRRLSTLMIRVYGIWSLQYTQKN